MIGKKKRNKSKKGTQYKPRSKSKKSNNNTINTKLIVPQNMYFIIKKFNDVILKPLMGETKSASKIIKSKLGLTPQQYGNLFQASDTGTWKNFNQWYEEVCCGALVSSKIGKTLTNQKVYNATLVLVKFGKKHKLN